MHRRARPGWPSVSKPRPREGEGTTLTFILTCASSIWASPERQEALCNLQAPRRTWRPLESPGEPSIGGAERTTEDRRGRQGKALTGWIAGRGALGSRLGGSAGPSRGRLGRWASADPLSRMGGWGGGLVHPEKITHGEASGGGARPLLWIQPSSWRPGPRPMGSRPHSPSPTRPSALAGFSGGVFLLKSSCLPVSLGWGVVRGLSPRPQAPRFLSL